MKGEGGDWVDCKPNVPLLLKKSKKSKLKDLVLSPIPFEIKPVEGVHMGHSVHPPGECPGLWHLREVRSWAGAEICRGCRGGLW